MFPVELGPDPLVQIPVEAQGRLRGFGARSIGRARVVGEMRGEGRLADCHPVDAEDQFPGPWRSHRRCRGRRDGSARSAGCIRSVALPSGDRLPRRNSRRRARPPAGNAPRGLKHLVLMIVLRSEAERVVEVGQFRADAIATSVGRHAGIEGEPGHVAGVVMVGGVDDVVLSASFSMPTPPESPNAKPRASSHAFRSIERAEDDAAVEVLVLIGIDGAVVGVAIGNGDRNIEAVVEQFMAVDHDAFVPLRHQLIHHRAFHGRHVTVLDQLFVAERLLELARLELQLRPNNGRSGRRR